MQGFPEASLSPRAESNASNQRLVPGVVVASAFAFSTRRKLQTDAAFIITLAAVLTWMVYDMLLTLDDEVRFP